MELGSFPGKAGRHFPVSSFRSAEACFLALRILERFLFPGLEHLFLVNRAPFRTYGGDMPSSINAQQSRPPQHHRGTGSFAS